MALRSDWEGVKVPVMEQIVRAKFMQHPRLLWRMALCGTAEKQDFRETVCALVFWHTVPAFVIEDEDGARLLRSMASVGKLAPSFSLRLLCLLAEAHALGRRSA